VTAITLVVMDYISLLGLTIQDIAWYKAGIFKSGSLAFSTFQILEVAIVLE
jgi:folylpolyglutamate synthase